MHWLQAVGELCSVFLGYPQTIFESETEQNGSQPSENSIVPQVAVRLMEAIKFADCKENEL